MRSAFGCLISLAFGMGMAHFAQAEGDPAAGAQKIARCAGCHGKTGQAPAPVYPSLAGQDASYLEEAMKAYRDGGRSGRRANMMVPFVRNLSNQDIADIAAFYSSQE